MDGVTILNTTYEYGYLVWTDIVCYILPFGSILAGLIIGIVNRKNWASPNILESTLIGLIIGFAAVMLFAVGCEQFKIGQDYNDIKATYHQVTIDDTVNFNEFIEKYEIIEQDGSLFKVKERNE